MHIAEDGRMSETGTKYEKTSRGTMESLASKRYRFYADLRNHKRVECGKEGQFACTRCLYRCKSKGSLSSHMMYRHPEKHYLCISCKKKYPNLNSLRNHLLHRCGPDGKILADIIKRNLSVANKHSGYSCRNCNRTYRHLSNLNKHQKYECGKEAQFACPYCPYKGKQKSHLQSHLINRHISQVQQEQ
ncbi:hypothetical protein O3M35_011212 [Rhynocoris fuscipes]|uniref:C2H2-type domain-containing protein n=1 Tax=Rhynocoris fuscipes TaxID=488301 RepID=A0AAW1CWQ3_9HEMI